MSLTLPNSSVSPTFWVAFLVIVVAVLAFDLGVLHRRAHTMSLRESGLLAVGYVVIALLFGVGVWATLGPVEGAHYFTAYVVEQSLSVDNVFVMSVVFAYFGVPREHRHRVLFWGVVGAMVFRAILIGVGAAAVASFDWLLLAFAAFLVFTGIKLIVADTDETVDIAGNPVFRWMSRHVPMTPRIHGQRFFAEETDPESGRLLRLATPLFFALVVIEVCDLIFAVDSIPAVLAISQDPFVVYTSNIFAVLNLRALYFVIDALVCRCRFLKPALAAVLVFIGGKIFWDHFIGEFDSVLSLVITLVILGGGIALSIVRPDNRDEAGAAEEAERER
jgi:tellurite resistance protein TerC